MDLASIFQAAEIAHPLAEFAGIVESVGAKVDRLARSELNAGLRMLEDARRAVPHERAHLLREARAAFYKATELEQSWRKAVSLLALSVTHHSLDDFNNRDKALNDILSIEPVTSIGIVVAAVIDASFGPEAGFWTVPRDGSPPRLISNHTLWNPWRGSAREEYHRRLVFDAVRRCPEATAVCRLQESVSTHLGQPIPWVSRVFGEGARGSILLVSSTGQRS